MSKVISIRAPQAMIDSLAELSSATDRSPSWHARKAMERYLAEELQRNVLSATYEPSSKLRRALLQAGEIRKMFYSKEPAQ